MDFLLNTNVGFEKNIPVFHILLMCVKNGQTNELINST